VGSVRDELVYLHLGLGEQPIPYLRGWELQRQLHEQRVNEEIPDTCLLLQHEPVFTAGKRTSPLDRPQGDAGAPVVEVDRGGKITWHGPGQLVGYPIIRLGEPVDVIAYVRAIEEAVMRACADAGLSTTRVEGRSGVWVPGQPERKVAAIGIRVSRGVTMHGFALNCDCDLGWFSRFVPCGIPDAGVTSVSAELGRPVSVPDMVGGVERHLADVLGAATWRRSAGPLPAAAPAS
jgi:lipoyl(octanoyl) transferase